jgi:glycosyltransferase involved in cell wall biosynthesis
MAKITIVIPVFNEEGNINALVQELKEVFKVLSEIEFEIIFVDDGSTDQSLPVLMSLSTQDPNIFYVSLSKNFGKDNALIAGISYSMSDAVITIDADLQHPPSLIYQFVYWWQQGYQVVYAYREDKYRSSGFINKIRSKIFYQAINALSDVPMENGISDYKLIDKKVVDVINNLPEDRPFLRGIIKWIGFKQKGIGYEPMARYSRNSKYTFTNLIKLATQGLTSFSTKPLTFAIYLGFVFSAVSLLYIPYIIISLHYHYSRPGWASVIFTISFFGGLQLMIMGIIGLYLGKTFIQSKHRPRYIIQSSNMAHDRCQRSQENEPGSEHKLSKKNSARFLHS